MNRRQKNRIFNNSKITEYDTFSINRMKSIKKRAFGLYSVLNKYLWVHGIGFEKRLSCSRANCLLSVISFFSAVIVDGSSMYFVYAEIRNPAVNLRAIGSVTAVTIINLIMRFLLYKYRRTMKRIIKEISEVYSKLCTNEKSLKAFRITLVVLLFAKDIYWLCYVGYTISAYIPFGSDSYHFGLIPPTYSAPSACFFFIIRHVTFADLIVTAYFCSVCFLLKQSLVSLKNKLQRASYQEVEYLTEMYLEIARIISEVNKIFQPCLLSAIAFTLGLAFLEVYFAIFIAEEFPVTLRILSIVLSFSEFISICLYGTSVLKASSDIKDVANMISDQYPSLLHLLTRIEDGISGFRILHSVVIDERLILSAIGNLLTYGILIATFNSSNSSCPTAEK